jgi:hypothetical protein
MEIPLKLLSKEAVPRALEKADRYRLLNEPMHAQSICLDILRVDPDNQNALVILLLALTDQFAHGYKLNNTEARDVIPKLKSDYDRAYYSGIIAERQAKSILDQNASHSGYLAHDFLTRALHHYEDAAKVRPAGNDDALLRWNTCARLMNTPGVKPRDDDPGGQILE